ncbi:MAG: hypothetical protein AYL32_000220 [Candidatus Bathyarchaeota archaeon B26-2]|nr:MAG: hypothetical protein AYL32_000220 [Candidatus Bathyarchaeota archaeon B26-2]
MVDWRDILKAQLFSTVCWYRNNKWMLITTFVWPYLMVGTIFGIGMALGSLEEYAERVGVVNPALYLLASSAVAMSSVYIMYSITGFVLENRWIGTLPYLLLSPAKTHTVIVFSSLPDALTSPVFTAIAIIPAAVYFEGFTGALRIFIVLLITILGMLPLMGLSVIMASTILFLKEESNIMGSVVPFILLVSGVYYPIEVLPRVLQVISQFVPVTYVVEATKIVSTYLTSEARMLMVALYMIGLLTVGYNLLATLAMTKVERAIKSKGAL